jgi:hypothetical protein
MHIWAHLTLSDLCEKISTPLLSRLTYHVKTKNQSHIVALSPKFLSKMPMIYSYCFDQN